MRDNIHKIVLTGGPCSGKTSSLPFLKQHLESHDIIVRSIGEAATLFIEGGFEPWKMTDGESMVDFQTKIMKTQIHLEDCFIDSIDIPSDKKAVVICDRGTLDTKTYVSDDVWGTILTKNNWTEHHLFGRYDAVIHLATVADGLPEHYTLENNTARSETAEEALANDISLREAWLGHETYKFIDNSTDFQGKVDRLCKIVSNIVGVPEPFEFERKFLVEKGAKWEALQKKSVMIEQVYISSCDVEGVRRIRKRGTKGEFLFFETVKKPGNIEIQKQIDHQKYGNLFEKRMAGTGIIWKRRTCFIFAGKVFELDQYVIPSDMPYDVLEVELHSPDEEIKEMPPLPIVKEVTGEKAWSNLGIAQGKFRKELE